MGGKDAVGIHARKKVRFGDLDLVNDGFDERWAKRVFQLWDQRWPMNVMGEEVPRLEIRMFRKVAVEIFPTLGPMAITNIYCPDKRVDWCSEMPVQIMSPAHLRDALEQLRLKLFLSSTDDCFAAPSDCHHHEVHGGDEQGIDVEGPFDDEVCQSIFNLFNSADWPSCVFKQPSYQPRLVIPMHKREISVEFVTDSRGSTNTPDTLRICNHGDAADLLIGALDAKGLRRVLNNLERMSRGRTGPGKCN